MSVEPAAGRMEWTRGGATTALDLVPTEVTTALSRLWSRLARAVAELSPEDWEMPSRCSEWRVVDVVNHLADINDMGVQVAVAAMSGERSGVFDGFDPRTTPKSRTDAADRDPAVAQRRLLASIEAMLPGLDSIDVDSADPVVETPLGRQPMVVSMMHVLWDTWLHERDIFLPLGHALPELSDEVRLAAVYTLRMAGFVELLSQRETRVALSLHGAFDGAIVLDVRSGVMSVRIADATDADAAGLRGDAATAVDALCGRGDLAAALDGPDELRSRLGSLRLVLAGA